MCRAATETWMQRTDMWTPARDKWGNEDRQYTLACVEQRASGKPLHGSRSSAQRSVTTWGWGWGVGGMWYTYAYSWLISWYSRNLGFPSGSAGKESACNVGDLGSIPGLGRSPGEGKSYPLQYSVLENSRDCIVYGVAKSRTRLSNFHFHSRN